MFQSTEYTHQSVTRLAQHLRDILSLRIEQMTGKPVSVSYQIDMLRYRGHIRFYWQYLSIVLPNDEETTDVGNIQYVDCIIDDIIVSSNIPNLIKTLLSNIQISYKYEVCSSCGKRHNAKFDFIGRCQNTITRMQDKLHRLYSPIQHVKST